MNFMVVTRAEADLHGWFGVCNGSSRTREVLSRFACSSDNTLERQQYTTYRAGYRYIPEKGNQGNFLGYGVHDNTVQYVQ
jgi:hypothetical protein